MKYCLLIIFCFFCGITFAQNPNATQIRKQMADIRQSTDWNNPDAAKKANEKIRELSKQLMMTNLPTNSPASQKADSDENDTNEEGAEYRMKLWEQMWETAKAGENADIDLAKPLREEIVQEYKDDEDPTVKSTDWLRSMSYLLIDLSMPGVKAVIDQMPLFSGITTLVVTAEKMGAVADLNTILRNASGYPLEELYIINLGSSVTGLPHEIGNFSRLKTLAVYNNRISRLPAELTKLTGLSSLQIQENPISKLLPEIGSLAGLKELGVAQTEVPDAELKLIQEALPACKITKE